MSGSLLYTSEGKDEATATITALKKRVTAERKRREECEAALREVAGAPNRIAENSRIIADYFGEGS